MSSRFPRWLTLTACLTIFAAAGARVFGEVATPSTDSLQRGFIAPPDASKPAVWWYWGESTTTDHGITQDLESMKRVGIGGVVVYEQVFSDSSDALKSLSPEWLARLRFATAECARLGMTLETNVSDGYVSGGPWITPALGMQRLVATDTVVEGGHPISILLPQPATKLDYYRDVAVLAYPAPAGDGPEALPNPVFTSSPAGIDFKALFSSDGRTQARIHPNAEGGPVLVQLDYGRPSTLRSVTYSVRTNSKALVIATQVPTYWTDDFYGMGMRLDPPIGHLEASDDGRQWRSVCELPATGYRQDNWIQQTVAFPAATARFFRLNFHGWGHNSSAKDDDLVIGGVELHGEARIDQWEKKSGNVVDFSYPDRTPKYAGREVIEPSQIIDVTGNLGADGKFSWDAPPGKWTILRLGHTPTGARTKHGRPENLGLESDKLSAHATAVQFSNYVGVILREVRSVPGGKLVGVNIDSAEHGSQNWTPDFAEQFERRRGYSLRRFLPAMMGQVVASREQSDKFLFDVRRTIADLMSEEYYGTFQKLCHAEGLTEMAQAPGIATCLPSDNLQAKGWTDIPMGEFWMGQPDGTMDCKEAASAAHVYGKPIAAAESFTGSHGDVYPGMMKPFADAALALGINRFVVLAYIHQPWDDRLPGVTQNRSYLPYQRHNTWWEDSTGFWTSLARSSYLMRQGRPFADILYDLGSDAPIKIATWRMRPAPPIGYDYDVCGDEAVIQRASVQDGRIVLQGGVSYRLLILADAQKMTLAAARQLRVLINSGATVLGPAKPTGSPSLTDGAAGDEEVRRIADELWGSAPLPPSGKQRTGSGVMIWGMTPAQALAGLDTPQDFEVTGDSSTDRIFFAHRRTTDSDIYFVANHQPRAVQVTATFRVGGRVPQRWDADTGTLAGISHWREKNGQTEVPLALEANASTFVVFAQPKNLPAVETQAPTKLVSELPPLLALKGPWEVRFTPGWGAPAQDTFARLTSWTENPKAGVRDYSGSAIYAKSFALPALRPGERVILDLGEVKVLAGVKLNGRDLGVIWKEPYALDVTGALKPGQNTLEVRVVNTWVNRLIGDAGLPPEKRLTWINYDTYHPDDQLKPSGLLGPVFLRASSGR